MSNVGDKLPGETDRADKAGDDMALALECSTMLDVAMS